MISRHDLKLTIQVLDGVIHGVEMPADTPTLVQLRDRMAEAFTRDAGKRVWGAKVFECRIPLFRRVMLKKPKQVRRKGKTIIQTHVDISIAPTLNTYGSMRPFMQAKIRKETDLLIMAELGKWPEALLRGKPRPRAVKVTRYSSSTPDEISADVIGGKIPIDRLVVGGVLMGDRGADLERDAEWVQAPAGGGQVLVEVFELLAG